MTSPPARATWWTGGPSGSTYWRCQVPASHLPGRVFQFTEQDIQEPEEGRYVFPRHEGAAIWSPAVSSITRATLASVMQENGTRVLMDADDNYLVYAPHYPTHGLSLKMQPGESNSVEAHQRYATWFDGIICSTPWLAAQYSELNPNVFVCPNSVDPDDWPEPEKPDDGIFRIGWSASPSHELDAPLVRKALRWASQQDGVEVVILGAPLFRGFEYTHVPWTKDLAEYRRSLGMLDVGICPVRPTPFSKGKSDIKALEYSMAGAMSLVSEVEPYRPWFSEPCMAVSDSSDQWEKAIRWCVLNRDQVPGIAAEAKDYVLAKRTIGQHIGLWEEAVSA